MNAARFGYGGAILVMTVAAVLYRSQQPSLPVVPALAPGSPATALTSVAPAAAVTAPRSDAALRDLIVAGLGSDGSLPSVGELTALRERLHQQLPAAQYQRACALLEEELNYRRATLAWRQKRPPIANPQLQALIDVQHQQALRQQYLGEQDANTQSQDRTQAQLQQFHLARQQIEHMQGLSPALKEQQIAALYARLSAQDQALLLAERPSTP